MASIFLRDRERNGGLAFVLPAILMFLVTAGAGAAETDGGEQKSGRGDWSPSLNVEFGIHAQELKAKGSTTFGARDGGTNTVSALLARVEAVVATPELSFVPGAPRLVLRGGGSFPLRETGATIVSTQRVEGAEAGTDLSVSFKDMWHAAVDLRFLLPIPNQTITIRPGFEYLQSRFRFEPVFTFRDQPSTDDTNPPRLEFKSRSDSDVHRFIGPTLAIESNVLRVGPVAIDVFLQGRVYFLIGDRDTVVVHTAPLLGQPQTATARMEANFIAGQVGFGLRGSF